MISVQIDIDKVDKTRFFKGAKGRYLNLVLIESPKSKFGDYIVKQSATKEEREQKVSLPILGNAKIIASGSGAKSSKPQPAEDPW